MAGFRTVVLKSKDGGEERNEEEEQGDEDGVLLSEVTEWQSDRMKKMLWSSLKLFRVGNWECNNPTEMGIEENKSRIYVLQTKLLKSKPYSW